LKPFLVRIAAALAAIAICGILLAQPSKSKKSDREKEQEESIPKFTAPVTNILVPVKVLDPKGTFVTGIHADQFQLFDNGKPQDIHVDDSLIPISMVIAIQCNNEVDQILPKINRVGNMLSPLLLGSHGEAAVIVFDSRVRTFQDFTSDPDKITAAVARIRSGSISSRLVDAIDAGEHMLRSRPTNMQKVILLISETRDEGSENRGYETLDYLQVNNVTVYQITMSRVLGKLTAPPPDPRPDILPPATHYIPPNWPATPDIVAQTYGTGGFGIDFTPAVKELFKNLKYLFALPAADIFTRGTGGSKFDFYRGKGLEDAIERMSAELHLAYMLSYSPNNKQEGGWHDIRVDVSGHGSVAVENRPGYWMAADFR